MQHGLRYGMSLYELSYVFSVQAICMPGAQKTPKQRRCRFDSVVIEIETSRGVATAYGPARPILVSSRSSPTALCISAAKMNVVLPYGSKMSK